MLTIGSSAAPGFDDPIALLMACHDKVRRFAALSLRLDRHLAERGLDEEASVAARNILRYFDVAAGLHHADEEEDLFPALRQLGDPQLDRAIAELEAEHEQLGDLWRAIRPWLETVAQHGQPVRPAELESFANRYPAHAEREERELYGAASRLDRATLGRIGRNMQARREVKS
ncbi:hemerythrin domain-containing protein [Chitinimonas lacunae]|uniref:Hemerythrin domain-containing protein n=1 Tax=Chitinimonas lacunae TaxID=1963018 RepID=A0ABV8MLI8_9NEIS